MKSAVYCGTRNLYQDMLPALKSLIANSDVEKVYLLIEDDEFPYELPDTDKDICGKPLIYRWQRSQLKQFAKEERTSLKNAN